MVTQSQKKNQPRKFKVGDIVSIKFDRVDKTSPLHSNLLLRKVEEIVNTYALDYTTELTFSAACKKAM